MSNVVHMFYNFENPLRNGQAMLIFGKVRVCQKSLHYVVYKHLHLIYDTMAEWLASTNCDITVWCIRVCKKWLGCVQKFCISVD